MPGRFIALGLVGLLLATPALAQDATPSPHPRYTVRVRPRIHLEHMRSMAGQVRLRLKHARPELRIRNHMHFRMRPFKMRDFRFQVRPKIRFGDGTAEI